MGGIIWLASYPKSGNTWLRAFLHNLLRNPDRPVSINALDTFCIGESLGRWYSAVAGVDDHRDLSPDAVAALRPRVHEAFTRSSPDSVFVKTHNLLGEHLGHPLVTMAHTAGAIYVVRNPLDVCLSMTEHYGYSIDEAIDALASGRAQTSATVANVPEFYGSWSQHVYSWTRTDQPGHALHVLRYEDMLGLPLGTFRALAEFLGLDPPRQRLDRAIKFASFRVLRQQEQRDGFIERSERAERFFRVGKSGQWKTQLGAAQIGRVVEAHRDQMQRFDYIPAGY